MKRPKRLSSSFVSTIKTPGRYGDGRGGFGLSLLVKDASSGENVEVLVPTAEDRRQARGYGPWELSRVNTGRGAGESAQQPPGP